MNIYQRILFLLVISLFSAITLFSQEKNTYRFRAFSPEGGFYYDGVTNIKQDKDGFIWIMMANNLSRFDGYDYKRYYDSFNNIEKEVSFQSMVVDKLGRLFVVVSNSLYLYNKTTDSFRIIYSASSISFLKVDSENTLWMFSDGCFGKYNEGLNQFEKLSFQGKPLANVNAFVEDQSGFFLLTWGINILRYNYETKQIEPFYRFTKDQYFSGICKVNNDLWLFSRKNKFYKIDIPTAKIVEEIEMLSESEDINSKMIHADKNEKIWIATQYGIYVFNTKTYQYEHYLHAKADQFSLPNNSVWTIEEDAQRNLWIGTFSGGLCYINLDEKIHFNSYIPIISDLNHNLISSFSEDDKRIWIATEGGGVSCLDKKTNRFTHYLNDPKGNSISSNNVKSIVMDDDDNLWLATYRGGLTRYDISKNLFTNYKSQTNDKNSLYFNNLRKLVLEPNSGLWIAYQSHKPIISFYSFKDASFTHYELDEQENYIFDIFHGKGDVLWVVTHKKLYSINTQTIEIKRIPFTANFGGGQALCADANDNIWIGTLGHGLIKYNTQSSTFTKFDEILKYNISAIYSICTDYENNIWLGTDNGLFRYNTVKNYFSRFDKKDGVQGQVFYPLASYKSKSDRLYFGGTNGFTIINPKNITQNEFIPQVRISDFYIDNNPTRPIIKDYLSIENTISFPTEIVLNHKQANFGFTFSSNNYLMPEKGRFRYRLKGYDNRWIEVDAKSRNVFYTKIPAGNYVFEVMASNNDGVWNDIPKRIQIKCLSAPWFSWWAYILYSLVLAFVVFIILRYYFNQKDLKLQLYLDKVNQEKKEEIHQSQLRFFTNISHDFRTPLSLIISVVDKLKEEGLDNYYYRILNSNAKRVLNLVNELMDFRTIENGKTPLQVSKTNVNQLIEAIAFDFNYYALEHNIKFDILTDPNLAHDLYIDKQILEKIVVNLLNNAFKYTKNGGHVSIQVLSNKHDFKPKYDDSFTVNERKSQTEDFAIVVSDTGIGITKESIESVFERFYKVKTVNFDSHLGTGIGLALVKSLVVLHKGEITIYSERNKGSDFVVRLSSDNSIYLPSEFLNEDVLPEVSLPLTPDDAIEDNILEKLSEEKHIKDKRRILLAEDNDDLRRMIADYLSQSFHVIEAENGLIASKLLKKTRIDLIISDIMMPQKDGIAFCNEVKNDLNTSHIPFVLLTAKTNLESKLEGADSRADMYFEKPVDFKLLELSIQNIFKHQEQIREYYSKNYFAESTELTTNQREGDFLRKFIDIIDRNLNQHNMDVNLIASELFMSRSKLYDKIKSMTGKSIIEFIINYRLRKAARLIVETDLSMREIMEQIGIESQSYFTRAFKKEFDETPTAFAARYKKKKN